VSLSEAENVFMDELIGGSGRGIKESGIIVVPQLSRT
jgi:hypothetical protein